MSKKVLVATVKPFAKAAVESIAGIIKDAGYELVLLESYPDPADMIKAAAEVDALIVRSDKVTPELFDAAKNLKIVVRAGAGYDNVDLQSATDHNVVVMNTPGQNSNAVAELAFGMMVYLARGCFNGKSGTELKGKKLGLHAYGNVGKHVARIARGFDMEVAAFDPYLPKAVFEKDKITRINKVEELYKTCRYVSLHIPANPETNKSINFDLMSKMPKNAVLVNPARKEIICEDSLLKMFAERSDFSYIADVAPDCAKEIESKYPGRYYFTPKKMGAQTAEANVNSGIAASNQIINFFENGDKTFQVNK
ncbi:MAG: 3-phosphoglycerate dehydrogenase [Candidatus Aminicenantes bacterium]|nr:3-phosphoglycerate dehydrogenase [Candidatus Aminicenantes bacterium]